MECQKGKVKMPEQTSNFESLLALACAKGASDLHWSSGESPVLRIAGSLERLSDIRGTPIDELINQMGKYLPSQSMSENDSFGEIDCVFEMVNLGRFRLHLYRHVHGVAAAIRLIPHTVPDIESLGLPTFIQSLAQLDRGLVLVTGPTGSGKSTTLAALVELINRHQASHIITIEDPIEFLHSSKRAVIRQREVGKHTESFASALRAALREDPDVLLVGELRDLETIHLALTAAETGHVVFATLHAAGAVKTIDRIVDVFPAAQQAQVRSMLADSLQAVVSQSLITTHAGKRAPNVEILRATPAVRALIREAKTHQLPGIMEVSRSAGMCTFEMHRKELCF
jgi:twitching motility protein PilT